MDIESLDLRLLRAFQLVVHGNLRKAATHLNQSIPAVSAKIKRLEEQLGVTLFDRLPNRMILTRTGIGLLEEVEKLFSQAEYLLHYLSQQETIRGRLSVSTGSDHYWRFAPKISHFLMQYPEVELSLQVHHSAEALEALSRGDLDISIGVFAGIPKNLEELVITKTSLSLIARDGDPILRQSPPNLGDLAQRRLILLPRHTETRRVIDALLAKAGVDVTSIIEVANCQTASVLVREGVGVGILHTSCAEPLSGPDLAKADLGMKAGFVSFSAVCRTGDSGAPIIRAFLESMRSDRKLGIPSNLDH